MELTVSIIALIISVLAFIDTRRANRSGARLSEQEIELVRHQLAEVRLGKAAEKRAFVSATLYKVNTKTWRLRVYNKGPAEAQNVRLILDDQNKIVEQNFSDDKFPMTKLEKGQSVEVIAAITQRTPPKEWLTIRWHDLSGVDHENRVEITI